MLSFFQTLNDLTVSSMIRESIWISPVVNVLHLLALVIFAGAVLIVDLRLLGRGARNSPLRASRAMSAVADRGFPGIARDRDPSTYLQCDEGVLQRVLLVQDGSDGSGADLHLYASPQGHTG